MPNQRVLRRPEGPDVVTVWMLTPGEGGGKEDCEQGLGRCGLVCGEWVVFRSRRGRGRRRKTCSNWRGTFLRDRPEGCQAGPQGRSTVRATDT